MVPRNDSDADGVSRRTALKAGVLLSSVGAVGVSTLSKAAWAEDPRAAVFDLDFAVGSGDADAVGPDSAGWKVDRKAPDAWETSTLEGDGDDGRLHIDIDESGTTSGFRSEQGKKYLPEEGGHWDTGHNTVLSYRFFIDPYWEDDDGKRHQTGMWGVLADANGDVVAYPVLEYQDSDSTGNPNEPEDYVNEVPDGPQFRLYTQNDEWLNLGLPKKIRVDPEEGGWVDVKARFLFRGNPRVMWFVNGALLAVDDTIDNAGDPALFREPILNSENFGEDADYYYDDIRLTVPRAGEDGEGRDGGDAESREHEDEAEHEGDDEIGDDDDDDEDGCDEREDDEWEDDEDHDEDDEWEDDEDHDEDDE
ncbi:hypothetical protein [Haloarchaeobius sp. HRN-SO-5]|uniref:hypothetical protein n=1 Tax=Haloarchaeobius sp. HRN-SO-5 TaxID=3446118 RepID=UPI003EBF37C0